MSNYSTYDIAEYFEFLLQAKEVMEDEEVKEMLFKDFDDSHYWRIKYIFNTFKQLNLTVLDSNNKFVIFSYTPYENKEIARKLLITLDSESLTFITQTKYIWEENFMFDPVKRIRQKIYQWQQGEERDNDNGGSFFTGIFPSNDSYNKNNKTMLKVVFEEGRDNLIEDYKYEGNFNILYTCAKPDSLESIALYSKAFLSYFLDFGREVLYNLDADLE